jgi:multiple sugar transport system permease protein
MSFLTRMRHSKKTQDRLTFALMLAPAVILLVLLNIYPLAMDLQSSFFRIKFLTREMTWIGLGHYIDNLTSSTFWEATWRTIYFTVFGVILQVVGGIAIALLLHRPLKGRGLARSLLLLPYVVPAIALAVQWRWMLNPLTGIVGYVTHDVLNLVDKPVHWLGNPKLALSTTVVIASWRFVPFMVLLFLARLQTMPLELRDAAKIDGANAWKEFWYVTIPWLLPTIIIAALLRTMWLFKNFEIIFLLTGGGPLHYTTTLPVRVYRVAFSDYKMGEAAAISILMLLVQLPIIIIYLRRYSKAEEEIAA